MIRTRLSGAGLAVAILLPSALFAAEYVFTDLGREPDQFISQTGTGFSVNSKGYIAGAKNVPTSDPTRTAQIGIPGNGVIDTNATLGGTHSTGNAINELDQLTGYSETAAGDFHAFFWDGRQMMDLGTLGGNDSHGFAINDAGQVTGESDISDGTRNAFFWDGVTMHDIGSLGGSFAYGTAISSNGFVTGVSGLVPGSTDDYHAFLWDGTTMQDLGTLGGKRSAGYGVNKHGVVAGSSELSEGADQLAMVWADGSMTSLGTLEGDRWSDAWSINSDGVVVGASHGDLVTRAFIWDGNSMEELPSPHDYSEAWLITDNGVILGYAHVPSDEDVYVHVVRWDPVPVLSVTIDIKPGATRNALNPDAKGGVWVAVLSDTVFDPLQIRIPSIGFGPEGAGAVRHKIKDVNRDGLADLVLRFRILEAGILCGDNEATLTGETFAGEPIAGSDVIETVKCR